VDDWTDVRDVFRMAIEAAGPFRVTCVGNGEEALSVLRHDRPDLAVIDVALPRMTGLELAARATALGIPVLLTTGHLMHAEALDAAGCKPLRKPFKLATLTADVREMIGTDPETACERARAALRRLPEV
jgi:CheY-like chemotaxis protein